MSSVWIESLEEYMAKMKEAKDAEIFIFKRKSLDPKTMVLSGDVLMQFYYNGYWNNYKSCEEVPTVQLLPEELFAFLDGKYIDALQKKKIIDMKDAYVKDFEEKLQAEYDVIRKVLEQEQRKILVGLVSE